MATSTNLTGYGPRRGLVFDGNESKYELWEVKFLAFMRIQKLYEVFVPGADERELDATKNANGFAELVQCLDDRSLSLIIREARDDGRKALKVLREHYQGKGKPRIISLYTQLTSLRKGENESTTDYVIRAETAATALKAAEEVISDGLLIAMVLKGLPKNYKTFTAVVIQREKPMTFSEFKTSLRDYEESEKSCHGTTTTEKDSIMFNKPRFEGICFKCEKKGHKSSECWIKSAKWCNKCRTKTHNTKDCRATKRDAVKQAITEEEKQDSDEHSFLFTLKDNQGKTEDSNLLVDTGATSHIINDSSKFASFDNNFDPNSHFIELADGSKANVVLGKGNALVKLFDVNGNVQNVMLRDALYIPTYNQNIFSVSAGMDHGGSINIGKQVSNYTTQDGKVFDIKEKGRLYYLNGISSSCNNATSIIEWHRILGHCNFGDVRKLEKVVRGMKITDYREVDCEVCTQGKMCQTRSREPDQKAKAPLDFVHCDLAGPIEPAAKDGFKYALCFIDDFTGINMIYFLKLKSDTFEATEKFLADVAPYGKVKRLRSDNGGEFSSQKFKTLLREHSIRHETSAPYSPHQNGTAERAWRSLFNMARCLLLDAKLPKRMWTYAVMASVYIRNRCFNPRLGKTPYEALIGKQPNLSGMHVFGSTCYAFIQNAKKLDARSRKGIFVGYDKGSPSYLVYYPESDKVEKVRCVKFSDSFQLDEISNDLDELISDRKPIETNAEKLEPTIVEENTTEPEVDSGQIDNTGIHESPEKTQGDRYPLRSRNRPNSLGQNKLDDNVSFTVDYCYKVANIPDCYKQALTLPEANKWQEAMEVEMRALTDNNTFELVPRPEDRQIVGAKWVYTIKTNQDGEETYKARFVAKGYSQIPDVDYQETFAPTARMSSVRMLLQRAVQSDMVIHQMDVKTAYLNAPIDCEIYIEQPEGFETKAQNGEKLVCKLKKSLYGLKQSGRNWNNLLHNYLIDENFIQSLADPCLYVRKIDVEQHVIIIVWVDDIIIAASDLTSLEKVKESLKDRFKMTDLGKLKWFLGTEFQCTDSSIKMNQTRYIQKVLSKFKMTDCKPKPTPCVLGLGKLTEEESPELVDPRLYRAIVGSLIYVMTGTRPDLCYIVTKLSQKMSKPNQADLSTAKHVLRYLKGTLESSLTFRKSSTPLTLQGYCDSDWGASTTDRRSITGYNFQLSQSGPLISWKSRKQPTVALSTCEAEYIALANAVQEAKFLKQLCMDMQVSISEGKTVIRIDNQGAINLARNPIHHQRSKHIDIKYHFIRLEVKEERVSLEYIPTEENIADIFTKPASKGKLQKFKAIMLGI